MATDSGLHFKIMKLRKETSKENFYLRKYLAEVKKNTKNVLTRDGHFMKHRRLIKNKTGENK